LTEKIVFSNPQKVIKEIEEVIISDGEIKYPSFKQSEQELAAAFSVKAKEIFGKVLPEIVKERIKKE